MSPVFNEMVLSARKAVPRLKKVGEDPSLDPLRLLGGITASAEYKKQLLWVSVAAGPCPPPAWTGSPGASAHTPFSLLGLQEEAFLISHRERSDRQWAWQRAASTREPQP